MKLDPSVVARLRDELLEKGQRPTLILSPAYESLTREGLLTDEETEALRRVDPVAEAMFLTMAADGDVAEEELDVIRGAIRVLTSSVLRSGTIAVMLETYEERLKTEGWEARLIKLAGQLSRTTWAAETAYGLSAAVALADREVTLEENELIDRLGELLGITDQRCCELLELIKQQGTPPWGGEP
jgi:uncharacterized tellurite resistance protein B-like protein